MCCSDFEPDPLLVEQIHQLRRQGISHAEILRWLRDQNLHETEAQVQMMKAWNLTLGGVKCIGGWWPDGTGALSDDAINELLDYEIALREKETAATRLPDVA